MGNTYIPDLRYSISEKKEKEIIKQIEAGEKQKQIAANFGITQSRVSQIIKKAKAERQKKLKPLPLGKFEVIYADPSWQYSKGSAESRLG